VGEYIKVPGKVLYKTPDDGLSNLSDEDKLGVKYSEIANYSEDKKSVSFDVAKKIKRLHDNSRHKFNIPTYRKGR
jgi:NH3-dependent NAD+ synthetase